MSTVTNGLILSSSKRTKLWSEFHRARLKPTMLHTAWKELLITLELPIEDGTFTLLQQSVYSELFSLLVCEQFSISRDTQSSECESSWETTVFQMMNLMQCGMHAGMFLVFCLRSMK